MQVSRGIGWSNESNLLYQILKQLNRLSSIIFGLKPKYKVYRGLITQTGSNEPTVEVFENTSGIDITWDFDQPGSNIITGTFSSTQDASKILCFTNINSTTGLFQEYAYVDNNFIGIELNGGPGYYLDGKMSIEILFY